MQQTGYDASATPDPAVARKITMDGLRRAGVAANPFHRTDDPIAHADPADLILVDLGPEHACADLLGPLCATLDRQAAGSTRQEKE